MMKSTAALLLLSFFLIDLSAQCPTSSRAGVHVVKTGENLYRIAKLYNVSTEELALWNNISKTPTLYACQELLLTNTNTYQNNTSAYNSRDELTTRGNDNKPRNTDRHNGPSFIKQSGNKHTIRAGETIRGLANLYGYTEERFRKINVLGPDDELSVGSTILSTDCVCDRVLPYDELNANTSYSNASNERISNTSKYANNQREKRKLDKTSAFMPEPTSNTNSYADETRYDSNSGSAALSSTTSDNIPMITSASNQSTSNNKNKNTTSISNNISENSSDVPAPARASYMSAEELTMLDEINLLRSNPAGYIQYVEQYRKELQRFTIQSSAGSPFPTFDELVAELKRTPPLPLLEPTPCLYEVAKKHGKYQQSIQTVTHDGPGFIQPFERIIQGCQEIGMILGNENLVSGIPSIRASVIELLVDHGVSKRGHRKNLLNPRWRFGVTYKVGYIGQSPNSWVQKFGFN